MAKTWSSLWRQSPRSKCMPLVTVWRLRGWGLQGAQPTPSSVSLTASASLNSDSNRPQPFWQPPPTACLTAAGAASGALSLLMHPWGGGGGALLR